MPDFLKRRQRHISRNRGRCSVGEILKRVYEKMTSEIELDYENGLTKL